MFSRSRGVPALRVALAAAILTLAMCSTAGAAAPQWLTGFDLTGGASLYGVSCPSSTMCVAVGGSVYIEQGGVYSVPDADDPDVFSAVSCGSPVFCMLVDGGGGAVMWSNGTFSSRHSVSSTSLDSVSCLATGFCAAIDHNHNVYTYSGSWSAAHQVVSGQAGSVVSCASSSFCLAVAQGSGGNVSETYNGATWSGAVAAPDTSGGTPESLSCTSASFCLLTDEDGYASIFTGSSWNSTAHHVDSYNGGPELFSSCAPQTTTCVGVDAFGNALTTSDGTTWSALSDIRDTGISGADSVSCATATVCVAGDGEGDAITYAVPVTNSSPPAISGGTSVGQTLSVANGSWTNSAAAITNKWVRCDESGGTACSVIPGATGPTYTLTSADVGEYLRVYEIASIGLYDSDEADSNIVAIPAPVTGGGSSTPGGSTNTGGTSTSGAGGTSTGGSKKTTSSTKKKGPAAPKLSGSITTSSGGTVSFSLKCAGTSRCKGKVTLTSGHTIGSGSYSIAAGKTGKVKITLTSAGKKLLRNKHGKLAITLKVKPSGGSSASHPLTLKVRH